MKNPLKESEKFPYTVKYWNGKEWNILRTEYLNPFDSKEEKEETLKRIRKVNGLKSHISLNISNFNNVYV
jgi:hypothetical protein